MTGTLSGWTYQKLLDKARRDLNRLGDARTATMDDVYNFICTAAPLWEWLDKDGRPAAKAAADEMKAEFDADPSHHPVQLVFDVFKGVKRKAKYVCQREDDSYWHAGRRSHPKR